MQGEENGAVTDNRNCENCSCSYYDYWVGGLTLMCKGFEVTPGAACEDWEMKRHATQLERTLAESLAMMAVAAMREEDAKAIVEEAGFPWDRWKSIWDHCVELVKAGRPLGNS